MTAHSIQNGNFTISRTVQAPVSRVYAAFADKDAKERWFKGPEGAPNEHHMEFREGGTETNEGSFPDGTVHRFKAHYFEIIPEARIVYAYEMFLNGERISVSVATIEFVAVGDNATQLTISEAGSFLDNLDTMQARQQGTKVLFQALEGSLNE